MKTNEIPENAKIEVVDVIEIPSDIEGGYYTEEIRIITLPDGSQYEDVVYHAPWQVGGNDGQIRELGRIND